MSEKYVRLVKSNTLFSSCESVNDASAGIRTKSKVEISTGRRVKRDSCFNRNRFDIDLYDELSETLNSGQPLKKLIQAEDTTHDIIEEEPTVATTSSKLPLTTPLTSYNKSLSKQEIITDSTFTLTSHNTSNTNGCDLSRANTISSNNRKKILEEWRRAKEAKNTKQVKQRPVFKVYHVDSKDFSLPKPVPPQQTHSVPSSAFTFKLNMPVAQGNISNSKCSNKFKPSQSLANLKPPVPLMRSSSTRSRVNTTTDNTNSSTSTIAFTATCNERPMTRSHLNQVNKSKQAITKNAPNGIFSTIKTSTYFNSSLNPVKSNSSKPPLSDNHSGKTKSNVPNFITKAIRKLRNSTLMHDEIEAPTAPSNHLVMNSTKIDESCIQHNPHAINLTIVHDTNKNEVKDADIEEITAKIKDASIIVSNTSNETKIITPAVEALCPNLEQSKDTNKQSESNIVPLIEEEHPKIIIKENDVEKDKSETLQPIKDIKYYRNLVDINTNLLNNLSNTWTHTNENSLIPDDIQGDIRSACGLAKLLIDERFAQFNDLIHLAEVYENSLSLSPSKRDTDIKVVMTSDLEGFWEMIEIQIKDVEKKFFYLDKCKLNNYVRVFEEPEEPVNIDAKKPSVPKRAKPIITKPREKDSEQVPPKKKPTFASFRANLKVNKQPSVDNMDVVISIPVPTLKPEAISVIGTPNQQQQETNEINTKITESSRRRSVRISLKSKGTPLIDKNELIPPCNNEKSTKSTRRKSKIALPPNANQLEPPAPRSRRSDLISWDDCTPCNQDRVKSNLDIMEEGNENEQTTETQVPSVKTIPIKSNLFEWFTEASSPSPMVKNPSKKKSIENKENAHEDLDDFLSFDDFAPIKLTHESNSSKMASNLLNTKNLNSSIGTTPNYRKSLAPNRTSMSNNINIINSPLLKIALISSHGKRLSTSNIQ